MKSRILLRSIFPSKSEYNVGTTRVLRQEFGHIPHCVVNRYPAGISIVVFGQLSGRYDCHSGVCLASEVKSR